MDGPLVFLTSTSDSVPSGRNARAIARASMVRRSQNTRSKLAQGTYHVFQATRNQEGKKAFPKRVAKENPQEASICKISTQKCMEDIPRILGPLTIAIGGLLIIATTRIRRELTLVIKKQPSLVRDALRRRQWAAAAFAGGTLRLTPEVHSAVTYLEHKLMNSDQSEQPQAIELQKYGIALAELQRCMRDPERRMQPSVLAASHILAICEMLDDPTSGNYLNFVNGIVSLSYLHACKGDHYARLHVHSRAGAIMVEALLTRRWDAKLDQPWSETLISAGHQGHISSEDASSFADSAELIFSRSPCTASLYSRMTDNDRVVIASRARRLHSKIKYSIDRDLLLPSKAQYTCSNTEILSERVAVMLGLDDFISQIVEEGSNICGPEHSDNYSFYADAVCAM